MNLVSEYSNLFTFSREKLLADLDLSDEGEEVEEGSEDMNDLKTKLVFSTIVVSSHEEEEFYSFSTQLAFRSVESTVRHTEESVREVMLISKRCNESDTETEGEDNLENEVYEYLKKTLCNHDVNKNVEVRVFTASLTKNGNSPTPGNQNPSPNHPLRLSQPLQLASV